MRTTEVGGRCLVLAAAAAAAARDSSHGKFQSDRKNHDVEAGVYTTLGEKAREEA